MLGVVAWSMWSRRMTWLGPAEEIMAARITIKMVNDELARLGHEARLEKASGYF